MTTVIPTPDISRNYDVSDDQIFYGMSASLTDSTSKAYTNSYVPAQSSISKYSIIPSPYYSASTSSGYYNNASLSYSNGFALAGQPWEEEYERPRILERDFRDERKLFENTNPSSEQNMYGVGVERSGEYQPWENDMIAWEMEEDEGNDKSKQQKRKPLDDWKTIKGKERPEKQSASAWCISCMESVEEALSSMLSCSHTYCDSCTYGKSMGFRQNF